MRLPDGRCLYIGPNDHREDARHFILKYSDSSAVRFGYQKWLEWIHFFIFKTNITLFASQTDWRKNSIWKIKFWRKISQILRIRIFTSSPSDWLMVLWNFKGTNDSMMGRLTRNKLKDEISKKLRNLENGRWSHLGSFCTQRQYFTFIQSDFHSVEMTHNDVII